MGGTPSLPPLGQRRAGRRSCLMCAQRPFVLDAERLCPSQPLSLGRIACLFCVAGRWPFICMRIRTCLRLRAPICPPRPLPEAMWAEPLGRKLEVIRDLWIAWSNHVVLCLLAFLLAFSSSSSSLPEHSYG